MTTPPSAIESSRPNPSSSLPRRGLFAAAWAAVAALVLKYTSAPLEAAAALQFADTTTTVSNTASGPTVVIASNAFPSAAAVFTGQSVVTASKAGIQGVAGLRGDPLITCGVFGESGRGQNSAGVMGYGNGASVGVVGQSDSGTPILGQVSPGSSANAIAIYGLNNSTFTGGAPGAGGFGVYGLSARGHGLVGATASAGAAAVVGATNGVAGAFAAAFYGPVIVGGDFTVVGGAKSAAVPHPDGSHRRLYCVESPESWFEDFGKGSLECGRGEVRIDPDFAAMVHLDEYHVFLTERGPHLALSVVEQTPAGFRVEADAAYAAMLGRHVDDLTSTFSWRLVAKRRDIAGRRLEPVTIPAAPVLPASSPIQPDTRTTAGRG